MSATLRSLTIDLTNAFNRWLFRLRGPEPAPIVLVQRRVFVFPTRAGFVFGFTVVLMLVGALNYDLSLGYVLAFLLGGLGIVTILHTFRNLVGIEITPGKAEPVFAGEHAVFVLQLHNHRHEPRYAFQLRLHDTEPVSFDLPAQESTTVKLSLPATQRGWLRPGRAMLTTFFPLGLVRGWSYAEPDMHCLVYPAPEVNPPPFPDSASGLEEGDQNAHGMDDFSGLRSHQITDSPRHIDWKAVAREAPLLTKLFTGGGAAKLHFDWYDLPPPLDEEARLSRLTAWLLAAQAQGRVYSLHLPGQEIAEGQGDAHLRACLKALALHDKN